MKPLGLLVLLGATAFFASASPAIGQPVTGVSLREECQSRLQEYVKKRNPGHFFYVEDPESKKYSCGFSFEDPGEFDRYPSSAQVAFTFCQNAADEKGIKARCELIARGSTILARSYPEVQAREDASGVRIAKTSSRRGASGISAGPLSAGIGRRHHHEELFGTARPSVIRT